MAEGYTSEIRMMGFDFNPRHWAKCDGAILEISEYQTLYALIGTTYGGNGTTTFALPDLRGRIPAHISSQVPGFDLGRAYGFEKISLTVSELGAHTHTFNATTSDGTSAKANMPNPVLAQNKLDESLYGQPTNLTNLHPAIVSSSGGTEAHYNMQPTQVINFCICLEGIFPSRN